MKILTIIQIPQRKKVTADGCNCQGHAKRDEFREDPPGITAVLDFSDLLYNKNEKTARP